MRISLKRGLAATASLALSAGMVTAAVVAAPAAHAATGYLLVEPSSGDKITVPFFTAPAACSADAVQQVTQVTHVTATDPAQQPLADKWQQISPDGVLLGTNFYSPTDLMMPKPVHYNAGMSWNQVANTAGLTLVAGKYEVNMFCQDVFGSINYDTWTNMVTVDAAGNWVAQAAPDTRVATTTTVVANPASATVGSPVSLTATVAPAASTGNVEFFDGTTSLGTAVLAAGTASINVPSLAAGAHSITAKYAGDAGHKASTSAPVTVTIGETPAKQTSTVLAVTPTSGAANQLVTLTGTVTPKAPGTCKFYDNGILLGSAPTDANGVCVLTNSSFAGPGHVFTASFTPTDPKAFTGSTSNTVNAAYDGKPPYSDQQTIIVTVPAGDLTIFTPYTPTNPLNLGTMVLSPDGKCYSAEAPFDKVTVTDTRAGDLGWNASLSFADFVGVKPTDLIGTQYQSFKSVTPHYLPNNKLTNISVNDIATGSPAANKFASAPMGASVGSVDITALFGLNCVPSSISAGTYTSTVTFTVA